MTVTFTLSRRAAAGLRRDDDGPGGGHGHNGIAVHLRGRRPAPRVGPAGHARLEYQVAAAAPGPGHRCGDLDHVAGPHRRAELDTGERRQESLVAVEPDA